MRKMAAVFGFMIALALTGANSARAQIQADQIDMKSVYRFAQLASAAYETAARVKQTAQGVAWVATPGHTHIQYFIIIDPQTQEQTIAVRGTIDSVNWDTNMDTLGVHEGRSGVLMHRGYAAAAATIYRDLKPRLRRDVVTNLTGHSLGGAVAAILATHLFDDGYKLGRVYTFGQPKFTNPAGARAYRQLPIVRVVHQNDVVATFPDNIKNSGKQYAHIGPMVNLLSGPYYLYVNADLAFRFSQGSLKRFRRQISVPDHKMKFYLSNLRYKQSGAQRVALRDRLKYIDRKRRTPIKRSFNFSPHR